MAPPRGDPPGHQRAPPPTPPSLCWTWLPAPVEATDSDWLDTFESPEPDPEIRYGLLESATFAYLVALEALGPRQRAALLLRDVLGHSASETAAILGTSEGNVRVLHLRARRSMGGYDQRALPITPEVRARHGEALERFVECLRSGDEHALTRLLTDSAQTFTDADGKYTALAAPLFGRAPVARFYIRAARHRLEGDPVFETRWLNGLPATLLPLGPARALPPVLALLLAILLYDLAAYTTHLMLHRFELL